jgi:hypothetical protein
MLNRRGPRRDPCGTPKVTRKSKDLIEVKTQPLLLELLGTKGERFLSPVKARWCFLSLQFVTSYLKRAKQIVDSFC